MRALLNRIEVLLPWQQLEQMHLSYKHYINLYFHCVWVSIDRFLAKRPEFWTYVILVLGFVLGSDQIETAETNSC